MDQGDYNSDVRILKEDEVQPQSPAEPPAEQEEQGLFGCRNWDIYDQDDPLVPSPQSSLYGMSQLICDVKLLTPGDPEVIIPCSSRTEAALQSALLD